MRNRPTAALVLVVATALVLSACSASGSPSTPVGSAVPGGTIVFGRFVPATDNWHVFTIRPDGTDEREIVLPGSNGVLGFSPDGSQLLAYAGCCRETDPGLLFVGIVNADGSDWRILQSPDPTLDLGCTGWSPDGSRLACEGWDDSDPSRNGIYTVRASDGTDLMRLTTAPAGFHDIPVHYSPDGAQLIVARDVLDRSTGETFIVNVDGTDLRKLPVHYGGGYEWTPDGTAILAGKAGTLYVLDADGENPVPIEIEAASGLEGWYAFGGAWSPDASQIVFSYAATQVSAPDLFVMNRDGSDLTRLTNTPAHYEESADWSR